ncbi:MAG: hypothetical protein HQ538_00180 [Parcubacteria group bacterium]|nr:hypothetical protein [Parcubacteria group bacterium]
MQIKIDKKLNGNPKVIMRRLGYKPWRDPRKREEAFIRRMGASFYPRFHVFCYYSSDNKLIIDLHFDARRPMHTKGVRCYEDEGSEVVRDEAARIEQYLAKM